MVARTPQKQAKIVHPLTKVDRCMARLQELQYTVAGGRKVISGVSLSPRSTRTYLKTSLRCKQESARMKDAKSPVGKFPARSRDTVEWTRMSLPAMLVGETVVESIARDIVESIANKSKKLNEENPKTPLSRQRRPHPEDTHLRARKQKEKQLTLQSKRSECNSPLLRRARSRINFKVSPPKKRDFDREKYWHLANRVAPKNRPWAKRTVMFKVSPPKKRDFDRENYWHLANRVSPKNRPWAKRTVMFPTPLFQSTPSQQHIFCKTGSPIIPRTKQTPHKFLIKSPPSVPKLKLKTPSQQHKFCKMVSPFIPRTKQTPHKFLIKSPPSAPKLKLKMKISPMASVSPARLAAHSKKSPKMSAASKLRRSFSPSKLLSPLKSRRELRKKDDDGTLRSTVHSKMSPPKVSKLRRSFSPSRLATRLVSPLKRKKDDADESGRGRRPTSSLPLGISAPRI